MSNQITEARIQGFKRGIDILSQQKGSKLQSAVRVEMQASKQDFYDQISATAAVPRTQRHGNTPLVETPHSRRAVTMGDWEWADLIDRQDRLRILNDPTNAYSMNAAYAMGRVKDQLIVNACDGAAFTGETGGTTVAFDTNNSISKDYGAVDSGLTKAKLIRAREILAANDTDDEETFLIHGSQQLGNLLNTTEVTSSDYNTVKALVQGEVDTFLGFKFIRVSDSILPVASTVRSCFFFRKSGMLLALGVNEMGTRARISERDDKSYATQVYYAMSAGATRMEEAKVGRIYCKES